MKKTLIHLMALSGIVAMTNCAASKKGKNLHTNCKTECAKENKTCKSKDNQCCSAKDTEKYDGINPAYMDTSVRPQDDFYSFVNGGWMKDAVIPADKASWGSFNELREKTDEDCMKILNNLLKTKYEAGSEGEKIQNLYEAYMDMSKRNQEGLNPVKADLAKIDAIKNLKDLQSYLSKAVQSGDNPLFGWGVYSDLKNSKMNAVYIGAPRLGIGKDYYQKESKANDEVIASYTHFVSQLLTVLGYKNADDTAKKIVAFEKSVAKKLLTNEEGRDANKRYNPKTMDELAALSKNINLPAYLKASGADINIAIVGEQRFYESFDAFINQKNLPLLKDYLKLRLISGAASELDEKMDKISFDFYGKTMQGQQEQRARNKRALSLINGVLGEAFGKLYVDQYFPAEAKAEMEVLISYLLKSYKQHISNLDWMSSETKVKALDKLSKFTVKVAYPDKWKDYSDLHIQKGESLYTMLKKVSEWRFQRMLKEDLNKPVDRSKWGMTPQTVNAYYSATNNEIVFPAAILQAPFFDFKADPAVNFGGIGAVIGHEISHGFDDGGARFDGNGNLNNWWTDADRKNFDAKVKQLADQYSSYEPVKGHFVNGTFTSGENIADLGGVAIGIDALKMYLKDNGEVGKINGFTQSQRFFMSWATVWRTKSTEKYMMNQVKTDPHTPGYFRTFGPIVNVDEWYKAFDVKEGDKLYKKPADRIKIW